MSSGLKVHLDRQETPLLTMLLAGLKDKTQIIKIPCVMSITFSVHVKDAIGFVSEGQFWLKL